MATAEGAPQLDEGLDYLQRFCGLLGTTSEGLLSSGAALEELRADLDRHQDELHAAGDALGARLEAAQQEVDAASRGLAEETTRLSEAASDVEQEGLVAGEERVQREVDLCSERVAAVRESLATRLERLQALATAMIGTLDVQAMLEILCERLAALLDAPAGWVVLLDEGGRPRLMTSHNLPVEGEAPLALADPQAYLALLERAEDEARARRKRFLGLYVSATNEGAQDLYRRAGFEQRRVRRSLLAGLMLGQRAWIFMRKDLL